MQRQKIIEVVYNSSEIPGVNPANLLDPRALKFRDAALALIAQTLEISGIGTFVGGDANMGEVSGRFSVEDFDTAEDLIWSAVAGTPHAMIRELLRYCDEVAAA